MSDITMSPQQFVVLIMGSVVLGFGIALLLVSKE